MFSRTFFYILFFFLTFKIYGQEGLWVLDNSLKTSATSIYYTEKVDFLKLNQTLLFSELQKETIILDFPDEQGRFIPYRIEEASILHPELAKKYPNNKSYKGIALDGSSSIVRFTVNGLGLHAMINTPGKNTMYINPISKEKRSYVVFKKNGVKGQNEFECLVEESFSSVVEKKKEKASNDLTLRTFELALATTGEYSQFHISSAGVSNGTDAQKRQAVLDAVEVTIVRVNAIFERDLALRLQFVANTDQLFYLDGNTDPYTNGDGIEMLSENQANIDAVIGFNNYDIGHVFSTGGGGIATLASPCSSSKARGVTGQQNPVGDTFDVDYVAHELGHQFGATHTFNGTAGNCSSNRTDFTAVEPGSGSTIMSYAGLCAPQNVQPLVNDYFHTVSIQQMLTFITSGSSNCDTETTLTTNLHTPTVNAGSNFTAPKSTPLLLKGQGSDADGDAITYNWEQIDNEVISISNPPASTQTQGAVFRSLPPISSPDRYLPELTTVLSGELSSTWQVLPSVARTMNFTLTVRDNALDGGQLAFDTMTITIDSNAGPFVITSQNTEDVFWAAGTQETILWDVANTNFAPVNCTSVNILLSLDGGLTFPIVLASGVANDGSQEITVPNNFSTNARIKVEGNGHIFYAVNKNKINITNDFAVSVVEDKQNVCIPDNAIYNVTLNFAAGFTENVTLSAANIPVGAEISFNPQTVNSTSSVQVTVSNTENIAIGKHIIDIIGSSSIVTRSAAIELNLFDENIQVPVLSFPVNGANDVLAQSSVFTWNEDPNVQQYIIEIATDALFNSIVESATANTNNYTPSNLNDATTYYWRVRPENLCAIGNFSTVFIFTTSEIVCNNYESANVPVSIPDENTTGVNTTINIGDSFLVNDVNVNITIDHSWMRDLIITLKSPSGTEVKLLDRQCRGDQGNINMFATFDDEGSLLTCANSSPVISGTVLPVEQLSNFKGEPSQGIWTLNVADVAPEDVGTITQWSLEICESRAVASVEGETFGNLNIWPNPTDEAINVSFVSSDLAETQIRMYDTLGRLILQKTYEMNSVIFAENLKVSVLNQGVYFIQIAKGKKVTTKRVLIF